jgi:hypothetical protein
MRIFFAKEPNSRLRNMSTVERGESNKGAEVLRKEILKRSTHHRFIGIRGRYINKQVPEEIGSGMELIVRFDFAMHVFSCIVNLKLPINCLFSA